MCDLMVLAFQTDSTRICAFMLGREGSEQKYRMVGVNEGHHSISHHQNRQANLDKLKVINTYLVTQLAYLTGKLKSVTEGDGTLLDNCMIAFGSAIADPNRHTHHDLPVLLVGRGGGTIKTGRYVRYKAETPLNNLWLAMLERFGAKADEARRQHRRARRAGVRSKSSGRGDAGRLVGSGRRTVAASLCLETPRCPAG